jgi:hypothetical protein
MWYSWTLCHSLLDLLLEETKRNIPSAGYIVSLAQKLNRFILKDYFDKLKQLLMQLDITDKPEHIYSADGNRCRLRPNKVPKVLDQKGARRVHTVTQMHGEEYFSSFMWK